MNSCVIDSISQCGNILAFTTACSSVLNRGVMFVVLWFGLMFPSPGDDFSSCLQILAALCLIYYFLRTHVAPEACVHAV